jgi:hypothetical protein
MQLKEPSRYSSEECHSILRLWRIRQANNEIPFKFDFTRTRGGDLAEAEYPEGMFDGLQPAGPMERTERGLETIPEEDPESDSDVEVFHRRKAACSDQDTGAEDEVDRVVEGPERMAGSVPLEGVNQANTQRTSSPATPPANPRKRPAIRKVIPEDSENSHTPRSRKLTRGQGSRSNTMDSSPTLAGSSTDTTPLVKPKRRPAIRKIIPEDSEDCDTLRPRTLTRGRGSRSIGKNSSPTLVGSSPNITEDDLHTEDESGPGKGKEPVVTRSATAAMKAEAAKLKGSTGKKRGRPKKN